jgi:hypothetical protein
MPQYSNVGAVTALMLGNPVQVWNAETPTPGNGGVSASKQCAIPPERYNLQRAVAAFGKFSGAPGAFEIDIQVASIDSDTYYQTIASGNITAVDGTNFTFNFEFVTSQPFVRMLMRSRTNSVTITAYFNLG